MPVFDLFHKRQKRLRGEVPDVYTHDELPPPLRRQIVQVMHDTLGSPEEFEGRRSEHARRNYRFVVQPLRRELAVFALPQSTSDHDDQEQLQSFILDHTNVEEVMSAVELICRILRSAQQHNSELTHESRQQPGAGIAEINTRFRESGVGYAFVDNEFVRIDSQHLHAEVVVPALTLLHDKAYVGADQEFRSAFEHFRKGNNKEALVDALKSFESTMKVICDKRGWPHDPKSDSASKLLKVCFDNGLIPSFWQAHMNALKATLEAGVPTVRNKLAGHGQGVEPIVVPDHLASYVLHMTASAIVFLVKSEQALG